MSVPLHPRLDDYLAQHGEQVEDLSRIASQQPYRSTGPRLPRRAVSVLELLTQSDLPRRIPHPDRAALDALREHGLVDDRNALTAQGRYLGTVLATPRAAIRVDAYDDPGRSTLELWLGAATAVGAAGRPPGTPDPAPAGSPDDPDRPVMIDVVQLGEAPLLLASWVGLGPAWSVAIEPDVLPRDVLLARAAGERVPPPDGANDHLREVWARPWAQWLVRAEPLGQTLSYLSVAGRGQFTLGAAKDESQAMLQSRPSALVWRDLLRLVQDSLAVGR